MSPTEMVDSPQLPECLCVMLLLILLTHFRSVTNHFLSILQVHSIESDRLGRKSTVTPAINGFYPFKKSESNNCEILIPTCKQSSKSSADCITITQEVVHHFILCVSKKI